MPKIVLHILNTGSFSGAENVVITIIREFRRHNIKGFRFVYVSPKGKIQKRLHQENIEYEVINKVSVIEIKRIIKKYKPDILHAHDFTASIICSIASGCIPVISHIHNNSPWIKNFCKRSIVYGLSCFRYSYMLGVSGSVFEEFIFGKYFRNKEKIIDNPINIQDIREKAQRAFEKEAYDIVFLGRFSVPKNPYRFIDIVERVNKKNTVSAAMIGDGDYRDEIEEKIRMLNLQNIIKIKGFMENPYGILRASKILCMPSVWEGYGLAAVEALALGVPVISTGVGGLPGIVNDSCGKICNTMDEFVSAIVDLIENPEIYEIKKASSKIRAEELNNIDKYINTLKEIYETISV